MSNIEDHGSFKIVCPADCGNAPKKIVLKEFNIAMASQDKNLITSYITDDVQWNIIGNRTVHGYVKFVETLIQSATAKVVELHIQHIITHGKEASVNGKVILENDNSISFCHVYNFNSFGKNSKIKEITSYIIKSL